MPVAVRDDLSEENLRALLAEGLESETLDYKKVCDVTSPWTFLQIVKDVAAMQVRGGYLVIGADDHGNPSGEATQAHIAALEQSTFRARLVSYLGPSIEVKTKPHSIDGNHLILIYIAKNPNGFITLRNDGQIQAAGSAPTTIFHKGVVYTRHGTATDVWDEQDAAIFQQEMISRFKEDWMRDATEIFAAALPSGTSGTLAAAPIGVFNWELDSKSFIDTATELIRRNDLVPIRMLLTGIGNTVGSMLAGADGSERVRTVLDRLVCLASLALRLEDQGLFQAVVCAFVTVYELPIDRYGNPRLEQAMTRHALWFEVIQRITAIGALAERLENWRAIRTLVLQRAKQRGVEFEYYENWYRHSLTRSSEANLIPPRVAGQRPDTLLSFAQAQMDRLECLRFDIPVDVAMRDGDGVTQEFLDSLCRFDLLACIVGIDGSGKANGTAFYPSFATYYEWRARPAADELLENTDMRAALFHGSDADLAEAFEVIDEVARSDNRFRSLDRYFGSNKVRDFVESHRAT